MFVPSSLWTTFSIAFDEMTLFLFPKNTTGRIQGNIDIREALREQINDAGMACGRKGVNRILKP